MKPSRFLLFMIILFGFLYSIESDTFVSKFADSNQQKTKETKNEPIEKEEKKRDLDEPEDPAIRSAKNKMMVGGDGLPDYEAPIAPAESGLDVTLEPATTPPMILESTRKGMKEHLKKIQKMLKEHEAANKKKGGEVEKR